MKAALLTSALLLVATSAHAVSVTLTQGASLQLALDNAEYDTLYLETAVFNEDAVVRRPVVILPAPTNVQTHTPAVRSLTIDATGNAGWRGEVRGLRVLGPATITTAGSATQIISGCRLDRGLKSASIDFPTSGLLYVTYCTIFGDVALAVDRTDFTMNTVIGGGVQLYGGSLGMSRVAASHVQDAPAIAIEVRDDSRDAIIENSTVKRAAQGLWPWRGGRATGNVVADVDGDGVVAAIASQAATTIEGNRFERCGRGIVNIGGNGGSLVTGNVVLNSIGAGIVAPGGLDVVGNTVALSGGAGITAGGTASGNLVAFNSGAGVAAAGTCNLIWSNGFDARSPGNIYADPLFCDLNAGDVHVSASSPAAGGSCGPIGALGAGCPARAGLAAAPDGDPDVGMAPFGVQQRGRMALVTLSGPEPASLELLDVAGRRISRVEIAKSGSIDLAQAAGVYFMRLTQGTRSSSAKAVVLR